MESSAKIQVVGKIIPVKESKKSMICDNKKRSELTHAKASFVSFNQDTLIGNQRLIKPKVPKLTLEENYGQIKYEANLSRDVFINREPKYDEIYRVELS